MKIYHEIVFADSVEGNTPVYTNPEWNELLATTEVIVIQVYATQASGPPPTLTVRSPVEGTASVYTNPKWNDLLAITETVVLVVYATQASGTNLALTVQSQLSGDERNWTSAQLNPEINAQVLSTSTQTMLSGVASSATPGTGFRRLQITLGGTSPKAQLRIFATGRGDQPWLGNASRGT